tara:strand:- start:131 stop:337 length:207 start_codon:yes stop_codon:yes gene_type:complete
MPTSQSKVMGSVTQTVRFIIERLQSNIAENRNDLELNEAQLRKIIAMVETSVQDSYNRSMNQIINTID